MRILTAMFLICSFYFLSSLSPAHAAEDYSISVPVKKGWFNSRQTQWAWSADGLMTRKQRSKVTRTVLSRRDRLRLEARADAAFFEMAAMPDYSCKHIVELQSSILGTQSFCRRHARRSRAFKKLLRELSRIDSAISH